MKDWGARIVAVVAVGVAMWSCGGQHALMIRTVPELVSLNISVQALERKVEALERMVPPRHVEAIGVDDEWQMFNSRGERNTIRFDSAPHLGIMPYAKD